MTVAFPDDTPQVPALPTLILGGGLAGLLCAWHLRRQGVPVEVWEAEDRFGGWVQTTTWEGLLVEHGPQTLSWRRGHAADRLLRALELPFQEVPRRPRWAALEGSLVAVPAHGHAFLTSPLLSLRGRARFLAGVGWPTRPRPGESLATWVRRRFGGEPATRLLPLLTRGLFATAPEALDPGVLASRLSLDQVRLEGGMGTLTRRLAKDLRVRTGLRATSVEPLSGGRWRARGAGHEAVVQRLILALPAFETARLLAPFAGVCAEALAEIPYGSVECWHSLHAPCPPLSSAHGFLVHPSEGSDLLGCTVAGSDPMHLRSFLPLGTRTWPAVDAALRRWFPRLPEAKGALRLEALQSLAAPPPDQARRLARILGTLPPGLDWVAAVRFGQGLGTLIQGVEAWAGE